MLNPTRFPIILYANYRTGSSALCTKLANQFNLVEFTEPHYEPEILQALINMSHNNYIVKFMPDQPVPIYKQLLNSDAYIIKLYREDKVEQITSFYIAMTTQRWHMDTDLLDEYSVPIDPAVIQQSINIIQSNDKLLDKCNADIAMTYEQLGYIEYGIKTQQPINYNDIKEAVRLGLV
jgi:hypothetical protein